MEGEMTRYLVPSESELSEAQQGLREAVVGTRDGLGPEIWGRGPFGVWQNAPNVGHPALDLGGAVRFKTAISAMVREVAICTVGVHYRAKFEFAAHRAIGIAAGLDGVALDRLAAGEDPGWTDDLALVHRYTQTLLNTHRIDEELYNELLECFGDQGVVEIVTTIGYYCLISLTLNAFEVPLSTEMTDPWPDDD